MGTRWSGGRGWAVDHRPRGLSLRAHQKEKSAVHQKDRNVVARGRARQTTNDTVAKNDGKRQRQEAKEKSRKGGKV